jgi:hypothetical protein
MHPPPVDELERGTNERQELVGGDPRKLFVRQAARIRPSESGYGAAAIGLDQMVDAGDELLHDRVDGLGLRVHERSLWHVGSAIDLITIFDAALGCPGASWIWGGDLITIFDAALGCPGAS